jgi:WD40 repeat protein
VNGIARQSVVLLGLAALAFLVPSRLSARPEATLKGHTDMVWSVAFSPDGKGLASASDDMTVKVWDVATNKEVLVLKGHGGNVIRVVFSPDGKRIATASGD